MESSATGLKLRINLLGDNIRNFLNVDDAQNGTTDNYSKEGEAAQKQVDLEVNKLHEWSNGEVLRMNEEFQILAQGQRSENVRLNQLIQTCQAEKASLHQQILAIQRRVEEIEIDIGHD